jgi:hypothetical protein
MSAEDIATVGPRLCGRDGAGFRGLAPRLEPRSPELIWQTPVPTVAAGAAMTGHEYMRTVVEVDCPSPVPW